MINRGHMLWTCFALRKPKENLLCPFKSLYSDYNKSLYSKYFCSFSSSESSEINRVTAPLSRNCPVAGRTLGRLLGKLCPLPARRERSVSWSWRQRPGKASCCAHHETCNVAPEPRCEFFAVIQTLVGGIVPQSP